MDQFKTSMQINARALLLYVKEKIHQSFFLYTRHIYIKLQSDYELSFDK